MTALKKHILIGLCLAMTGVTATGCGRRSALDTPYEAGLRESREARRSGEAAEQPDKPVKDKPFILDGLIE